MTGVIKKAAKRLIRENPELAEEVARQVLDTRRSGLSHEQLEVFDLIKETVDQVGYSPSIRELTAMRDRRSIGGTHRILKELEARGCISVSNNGGKAKARSIKVLAI